MKRTLPIRILLAAALLLPASCVRYESSVPPDIQETIDEIDAYRADDTPRSIAHSYAQNPAIPVIDDAISTAGRQFSGRVCRLRLADVLLTTLKNNRTIQIQDYGRDIADEAIQGAQGIYDLMLDAGVNYNKAMSQLPQRRVEVINSFDPEALDAGQNPFITQTEVGDRPLVSKSRRYGAGVGLSQLLPTGAVLSVFTDYLQARDYNNEVGAIDPYHSLVAGIALRQPLLQGLGEFVTNAPIRKAYIDREIAGENFRREVIDQLADAVNAYYDLVFAINNYEVQRLSLERARELQRVTRIKVEQGVEAPNVLLQAEAEAKAREAELISAERAISDASDTLKRIMQIEEDSDQWELNLIPVDRPTLAPVSLNETAVYQEALRQRPDYRIAQRSFDKLRIDERVARNARLPRLDLTADYQTSGLEGDFDDALDYADDFRYDGYSAGLEFSYPLQNRRALAGHKQTRLAVARQAKTIADLEELIRLQIRQILRALETNLRLIQAFAANVEAEEAKLDAEIKRYEVGSSTIFEILDFQEDLAAAQVRYLESVVNYNKSLVELQRSKGSFLSDYRTEFLDKTVSQWAAQSKAAPAE